jgi:hypothetical protein
MRLNTFLILVILVSVSVPVTDGYTVNVIDPLFNEGWNLISGTGYYPDETVYVKCHRGGTEYIDLGSAKVNQEGSWTLYFSIEGLEYWPNELGPEYIWMNILSSQGSSKKIFASVSEGSDPSIFPSKEYFDIPTVRETRIISDVLWKIYVKPDFSSILYKGIPINRVAQDRRIIKNLHFRVRDK